MKRISARLSSFALALAGYLIGGLAFAQSSGFLDDYSKLKDVDDFYLDQAYFVPGALDRLKEMNAVMVDQPEIFIAEDSPYKGAKPDAMKILADTLREGMRDRVATRFNVTETPGPGTIYLHWAITDLYLQKKKKKFYAYTPTGFILDGAKNAVIQDIWKKVDIVEMSIEAELVDSANDEVLVAVLVKEGARKDKEAGQKKRDPVTWEEIDAILQTFGSRLTCRMDNARKPDGAQEDCRDILIEADKKK